MNKSYNIFEKIELHPNVVLVIYTDLLTNTNDAIIVKNKPQSKTTTALDTRVIKTISDVSARRNLENRTEIITLELDTEFYIAVTDWCISLKITFEQLAFAFIEFICIKENRDVVIPWMKELQNEQY